MNNKYQEYLAKFEIPEKFYKDFETWVDSGDASVEFQSYYNEAENCQKAVEEAFAEREDRIQTALQAMKTHA